MTTVPPVWTTAPMIDYARFCVRGDVDIVMQKIKTLTDRFDGVLAHGKGLKGDCKSYPVPATGAKPAGRVWECWGTASTFVYGLDFRAWFPHLSRLDVRRELPTIDALGLDVMYSAFRAQGITRTVHRYHSPARQKRNGQSAGGDSLAVGSHKSDFRTTWYKHDGRALAWEIQCQHDALGHAAQVAYTLHKDAYDSFACWEWLQQNIIAIGEARTAKGTGLDVPTLLRDAHNARADTLLYGLAPAEHEEPAEADAR